MQLMIRYLVLIQVDPDHFQDPPDTSVALPQIFSVLPQFSSSLCPDPFAWLLFVSEHMKYRLCVHQGLESHDDTWNVLEKHQMEVKRSSLVLKETLFVLKESLLQVLKEKVIMHSYNAARHYALGNPHHPDPSLQIGLEEGQLILHVFLMPPDVPIICLIQSYLGVNTPVV